MTLRRSEQEGFREGWLTTQLGPRIYYRDYGDRRSAATPVLCLPGLARHSRDYHGFATRLAPLRRVVVPDYRGRGFSDREPDWRRYAPTADLLDLRHLLAALGLERVALVGTSYGGLLSMGLGAVAPGAIERVVMNDVGPEIAGGGEARIIDYIGRPPSHPDWPAAVAYLRGLLPTLSLEGDRAWLDFARATYFERQDGRIEPAWDPAIVRPLAQGRAAVPDLWLLFRSLGRVPLLVIRGELSDVLTAATLERMSAEHPALEAVEVPDCGHAPTLAEPAAQAAIDRFLG